MAEDLPDQVSKLVCQHHFLEQPVQDALHPEAERLIGRAAAGKEGFLQKTVTADRPFGNSREKAQEGKDFYEIPFCLYIPHAYVDQIPRSRKRIEGNAQGQRQCGNAKDGAGPAGCEDPVQDLRKKAEIFGCRQDPENEEQPRTHNPVYFLFEDRPDRLPGFPVQSFTGLFSLFVRMGGQKSGRIHDQRIGQHEKNPREAEAGQEQDARRRNYIETKNGRYEIIDKYRRRQE